MFVARHRVRRAGAFRTEACSERAGRLTLGCSRRGPLRSCLPSCAIMASRATRLNPGPLDGSGEACNIQNDILCYVFTGRLAGY